jgi:hypothetical protein
VLILVQENGHHFAKEWQTQSNGKDLRSKSPLCCLKLRFDSYSVRPLFIANSDAVPTLLSLPCYSCAHCTHVRVSSASLLGEADRATEVLEAGRTICV